MTISSTDRLVGPLATDGVQTAFPFDFKVFTAVDVEVTLLVDGDEDTQVLDTDYTVVLNADQDADPGGTVTFIVAPDDSEVVITSRIEALQPTEFTNTGGFYPRVLNAALDRLTILIQQLAGMLAGTLRVGLGEVAPRFPSSTGLSNVVLVSTLGVLSWLDRAAFKGDKGDPGPAGPPSSSSGWITPQQFGAVGNETADDTAALNAWLEYLSLNKVPFAALVGNFRTTASVGRDFNYFDGGATTDKFYTTSIYCHGRIRGDGAMDQLLWLKKAPFLNLTGNLHLMGRVDGGGDPWSTRNIMTGLYIENCGNFDASYINCSGFACYGVETGPSGTNTNHSRIGHLEASRVGSAPRDGDAVRGQRTTFSARVDSGGANSFGQRSTLTVAALPPVYMDGVSRCVEVRIGGTGILYTVLATDRGASTISVFPWLPGGVTTGDIEYYFGAAFGARGNDANLIDIGTIKAQACGGALDLQCLYGGTYGTVHCEASGVALRIGRDPSSTFYGASIGRLYCEGTTKDIRLNSGSAANVVIDSAAPVDFAKVESGAGARDGAFVLGDGNFAGMSIGADGGGTYVVQKRTGTTVELDFNKPRADRQYIAANLDLVLTDLSPDLRRLFQIDGGLVTCRAATGGCTTVDFTSSGTMTVNGGASASFGPYAGPVTFSVYANGTDWSVLLLA